ncbi:MAG: hypothetical protein QOI95_3476 [Acidimicrobiaceae bacterium]|jgi:peptidoglycan/LPS O-acetylase OafA/YrhL
MSTFDHRRPGRSRDADRDPQTVIRSANLDVLRAVAALAVLAGHSYLLSGSYIAPTDRNPVRLLINNGAAGVWLFFALSGYLITLPFIRALLAGTELPSLRVFATRRIARIFPAYLVAFAIVLLLGVAPGVSVRWWQIPVHAALLHNLVPGEEQAIFFASWTLTLEVVFYVFVPLVAIMLRRVHPSAVRASRLSVGVLVLWTASVVFTSAIAYSGSAPTSLWLRLTFPSMLSMFCPGILVAIGVASIDARAKPPSWFLAVADHRRPVMAAAAVLILFGALGATSTNLRLYDGARQLFAIAFGIVLVLALTRPEARSRGGQLLARLGLISYGIYLWHSAIVHVLVRQGISDFVPLARIGALPYLVHVAFLLALTLPLAWISWVLIESPAIAASKWRTGAPATIDVAPGG